MLAQNLDPFNNVDLPEGLTGEQTETWRQGYAAGHRDGYTARVQHDMVDLLHVADPADVEDRHAVVHRISDRGRAA
jgi:Txe/YoeB family toxin of Txe-Axe toxin-antitoxin module